MYIAKFNCTVPGTIRNFNEECYITTHPAASVTTSLTATNMTTSITATTLPPNKNSSSTPVLISVVIGLVVIVVVILVFVVCFIIYLMRTHFTKSAPLQGKRVVFQSITSCCPLLLPSCERFRAESVDAPKVVAEDFKSDVDHFYETVTIQETDMNQSNVLTSTEQSVSRSCIPNSAVQLNQTEVFELDVNQSYIPISTIEVNQNMAYGTIDDVIDLSTNQAYIDLTDLDTYKHDGGMEYEHVD